MSGAFIVALVPYKILHCTLTLSCSLKLGRQLVLPLQRSQAMSVLGCHAHSNIKMQLEHLVALHAMSSSAFLSMFLSGNHQLMEAASGCVSVRV